MEDLTKVFSQISIKLEKSISDLEPLTFHRHEKKLSDEAKGYIQEKFPKYSGVVKKDPSKDKFYWAYECSHFNSVNSPRLFVTHCSRKFTFLFDIDEEDMLEVLGNFLKNDVSFCLHSGGFY